MQVSAHAPPDQPLDYVLVGGGLQNGLIALALMRYRPSATFALVERAPQLGNNHLWSFHAGDLGPRMSEVVAEVVARRWPRYSVAFPNLTRELGEPYACISSAHFHDALMRRCALHRGAHVLTGTSASRVEADRVVLAGGSELRARVVIDGRGPAAFRASAPVAYQKFIGLELVVRRMDRDAVPTIMDARVPQRDGFRFFYVLPLSEERVLVEETYFSDSPKLDVHALRAQIIEYAARHGLEPVAIAREERGVLPLPMRMPRPGPAQSPFVAGFAGGWFHPTTGYSFPVAARLAELFAAHDPEDLPAAWARARNEHAKQARFCTFLNRLLYGWFAPEDRWNVLERFYRLPAPTIRRFYALTTSSADRARIVCGRPPRGMSLSYATARADSRQGATV